MSFWWYTLGKRGKRHLWLVDTDPMLVVMGLVMTAAIIGTNLLSHPSIPFVLAASGLACLTLSKISLFRRGIWLSFGPGLMSKGYATLYKVAYVLIGMGVLLMLLLLSALWFRG